MGREATCTCAWNGKKSTVKALIEPPELILRGELRRRVPIGQMQFIKAERGQLHFTFSGESVTLFLGEEHAAKWADALLRPPPTLAKKLGITAETIIWMIGSIDDESLKSALAQAKAVSKSEGDLILAPVDTPAELHSALMRAANQLITGTPIWFIYPKGPGHPLNENLVRSTALAAGIVDTKVASVSPTLTALRFNKRRT
ncbi:DUF3052 family protein [Occallatibacter savannae]|uniref:DUF3052 family protein n=1 Tax=Occallatibacter savannae TaxID=1002691 RepID=UPI0013A59BB5|nr:DUF3052 family protein [Occallatibacter savannae]